MEKIMKFVRPAAAGSIETVRRFFSIIGSRLSGALLPHFHFLHWPHHTEHRGHDFENEEDYLFLPAIHSAKKHIYAETISFTIFMGALVLLGILLLRLVLGVSVLVVISGAVALFYFVFLVFKLWVVAKGASFPLINFSREEIRAIRDEDLPHYTVLIPLLHEAEVIPQIIRAMTAIDYPNDKLEYIITLEEHDTETRDAILANNPPGNFRILTLPDVKPKTKPKALNVAFRAAKGEFLVIYDAEIIPDPDQLKKAYLAFRKHPDISCLQVRLDHYNADQNLLTKLFNAEFAFYYDLFLPGLQRLGFPIPLSGHSTHFRKGVLEQIGAWDPYNVTEDCDVGIRLYRSGFQTGILNSISREEATSSLDSWIPQRTRWMKGFIQTSIVHLRHPFRFQKELGGWKNFWAFFLTVPGTIILNILNFIAWITQFVWLTTESAFIQLLFPPIILYFSVVSFISGTFVFMYMNLLAMYRRERYHIVKYILLTPVYWILLAIATLRAAVQIISNPHSWEKTKHGSHLS